MQALHLFPGEYSYVVVGSIGLAESFTFATLGIINKVLMSEEDDPYMYLYFFLTLAAFSFITVPIQWAVSTVKASRN